MNKDPLLNRRYRLQEQLGAGGMAIVFKAHDLSLGRSVAIKILRESLTDDEFLARFQREARAVANLAHANIVTVHDFGVDKTRYYMVMEYVDGQDLKSLIREGGPFTVERALDYGVQICAGVGYAHRAGLVHCDLKPQNVLVMTDGRVKVTDFGIARALSTSHPDEHNAVVWGSPQYFSPEQAAGEGPTPSSDVYSIGVMLFEMLTGELPFRAATPKDLAMMHLRDEPPPLVSINPAVPETIDRITRKILAKEPAARYRTADQLGHILRSYRDLGEQATGSAMSLDDAADSQETIVTQAHATKVGAPKADTPTHVSYAPIDYDQGVDWLAYLLGGVALLAVLGLIPLWLFVYLRYNPPAPVPVQQLAPLGILENSIFLLSYSVNGLLGIIFTRWQI